MPGCRYLYLVCFARRQADRDLGLPAGLPVFGDDRCINPAPDVEIRAQAHEAGCYRSHQFIQDIVGHRLVKNPPVTERPDVVFQGLQFDTQLIGNVLQMEYSEIRLPRARTEAGKFRKAHANGVGSRRFRVLEGLQNRLI